MKIHFHIIWMFIFATFQQPYISTRKRIKDSLLRQKSQFRNFIKTWQIYVNSYEKPPIFGYWVIWYKEWPLSGNDERNFYFSRKLQKITTYNLRSGNHLARKNIWTTQYGIESVSNLGAKLWNLLPGEIKSSSFLTVFKNKISNGLLKYVDASFVRYI